AACGWSARRRPGSRPGPRAGRVARNGSGGPLAGLPVQGVVAAPAAVLAELDPVGRVPLRLLRLVVAPLALRAGERDAYSDSGCHVLIFLLGPARSSGGRTRTSDTRLMIPLP